MLDGADCVMLSGETAKGSYPVQSGKSLDSSYRYNSLNQPELVLMMAETCALAESAIAYPPLFDEIRDATPRPTETAETVAMAAVAAAAEQNADAILVLSTSGNSARLISKFKPSVPILTSESTLHVPQRIIS